MKIFTSFITALALSAILALYIYKPAEARTVDCNRSDYMVNVYTQSSKKEVEVQTFCFPNAGEAEEFVLHIQSNPIVNNNGIKIKRVAIKDYTNF